MTNRSGSEQPLSKRALGRALGISAAMVLKLEARGMPVDSIEEAQRWRAANLDPARIKGSEARAARNERADELLQAKLEREQIAVQLARLELEEERGDLVRVSEIRQALSVRIAAAREAFSALPYRLAPVLAAETDHARVFTLLDAELKRTLALLTAADGALPAPGAGQRDETPEVGR